MPSVEAAVVAERRVELNLDCSTQQKRLRRTYAHLQQVVAIKVKNIKMYIYDKTMAETIIYDEKRRGRIVK